MRKIVIDGANGFVASHFIKELTEHNQKVTAFARKNCRESSQKRIEKAILKTGASKGQIADIKVYDYELKEENFALSETSLSEIFNEDVDFFHFAANLKFSEKDKEEIFSTNINGMENAISTYLKYATPSSRFFYISTVYSCGKTKEPFLEKFYPDAEIEQFRNYYEQSKRFAENRLKAHMERKKFNLHIIRLAQVVGNRETGVTTTNYGVFDFAKRIKSLAKRHPNETVRIKIKPYSTQNFIAVNVVARYLYEISRIQKLPVIINVNGNSYVKNQTITNCLSKLLPINIVFDETLETKQMTSLERIISAGMKFTGIYANTILSFDRTQLEKLVDTSDELISEDSLYKMIHYFLDNIKRKNAITE
ncbi:MAG: SDR family oxidoreductase [Prolixibacteraceae bacterium]|nr:SDR family oxidoreductase [Prolixibacteraceae bacterium]